MRSGLPSGTVTFLFTDVEGSTRLLHELGAKGYATALAEHRVVVRTAFAAHGGVEVDTQGDAFFAAFPTAPGALSAAGQITEALSTGPIRVRVGLHTGTPLLTDEGYVGEDVHRAARIAAAGHGGQVLVSSSTAALLDPGGSEPQTVLRDLGEHRFKDLSAPERVYQLGDSEFPALKSLYRTNLPVPATPFLGRESELREVVELLTRDDLRLLTLTGPGGTGKTRLALQAAAEASESFPDGIYWLPLAPLRDASLLLSSLAQTLALKEEFGRPLQDTLTDHLAGKRLLLLLDNLEHLLPHAATPIAALRDTKASILVTSRERLRIKGEQTWPVPPLAAKDGTALFTARACAVEPSFSPTPAVDELCARLDELPLAIELAAARTAVFSTEQLLERLSQRLDLLKGDRDADPRQQTLRATIEWSHDLLTPQEQQLFRRLAVFSGGCAYDAAEHVADADPDTLQSLLDKSLLRKRDTSHEPRYWMLETMRGYAAEQLEDSSEAAELGRGHAEHFLALAEEAEPHLVEGDRREWLDRLEREHDNLRAALDHLEAIGESQCVLRLAGALSEFWDVRVHTAEGRRRLEGALARDERPTTARGKALNGASLMAGKMSDIVAGRTRAEEALALHRTLGDTLGTAHSLWALGYAHIEEGDPAGAQQLLEESVRLFRELGLQHVMLFATRTLAWTYVELGDLEQARAMHEENLTRARALEDTNAEAVTLGALASIALDEGRVEESIALRKESLCIPCDPGDPLDVGINLCGAARTLTFLGRGETAARLLACYEALCEEIGTKVPWVARMNEETLASIRAQLDEAAFAKAWKEGRALTVDEAVALALGEMEPDA